jgi:hypothetical protein
VMLDNMRRVAAHGGHGATRSLYTSDHRATVCSRQRSCAEGTGWMATGSGYGHLQGRGCGRHVPKMSPLAFFSQLSRPQESHRSVVPGTRGPIPVSPSAWHTVVLHRRGRDQTAGRLGHVRVTCPF